MTLPTFLGIGAPRSGTTWLHELLDSHPNVYVPPHKEIRFFELYYDRGLHWYESVFPPADKMSQYRAVGEISPGYLYCPDCPKHIASLSSITKLLLILRNPVDRAYSDYGLRIQYREYKGPFEDFLIIEPKVLEMGFYSRKIKDYLRYFEKDQILVLIFERAVVDVLQTKSVLARFLDIDVECFPLSAGTQKANKSFVPKWRPIPHSLTKYVANKLHEWNWEGVFQMANKAGRLFGEAAAIPPMKPETRQRLTDMFRDETQEIESLLGTDLACWK